jgi:rod shape determining protein RodA
MKSKNRFPIHMDGLSTGLILLLSIISWITLYSAAHGNINPWTMKQIIRFGIGFVICLICARIPQQSWMAAAYPFYAISLVMLIGVEIMGSINLGAQRWIDLYVISIQPSELMKIAIVLVLARYFQIVGSERITFTHLLFPILLVAIPTLLVLKQPDLGTAMMFIFVTIIVFFVIGVSIWFFIGSAVLVGAISPILWSFLYDYQKKRILMFLDPESDRSNAGYHVIQSKIAIGSGGIWGKGFMEGTQCHLQFLPERHTDSIFTMFSEEFGFIGGCVLIALYVALIISYYRLAVGTQRLFSKILIVGISGLIFLYFFINMSMIMGLLPMVGVPLPFMSYGGTALLTLLIGHGLVMSANQKNRFN